LLRSALSTWHLALSTAWRELAPGRGQHLALSTWHFVESADGSMLAVEKDVLRASCSVLSSAVSL